jgi:HPr kinase/phosphorylase
MGLKVEELLEDKSLLFECVAGRGGLENELASSRLQKPGLLLTGRLEELHSDRIQILGGAEIGYLKSINSKKLAVALAIFKKPHLPPAIVVTRGIVPPPFLSNFAEEHNVPLLTTKLTSSVLLEGLIKFLDERLAPSTTLHGVLVDLLGIGILIKGKSGIGKSECALDLISRGYRLVADDVVLVKRRYPAMLFGMASNDIPYHIEVRGIGIVNVKDIFGITAIREKKQMDLVIELVQWDPKGEYERLGLDETKVDILGVELPYLKIPVSPGRSVATIVEVAARNQILKIMGYDLGRDLIDRLNAKIEAAGVPVAQKD